MQVKAKIKGKVEERINLKWEPIEKFLKVTIEGKDNLNMRISCSIGLDYETVVLLIYSNL